MFTQLTVCLFKIKIRFQLFLKNIYTTYTFFHLWVKLEGLDFDLNTLFDLAHHIVKKG